MKNERGHAFVNQDGVAFSSSDAHIPLSLYPTVAY